MMSGSMSTLTAANSLTRKVRQNLKNQLRINGLLYLFQSFCFGGVVTGKEVSKAPKIQRLVTPLTLQRKRARIADKKKRIAKANADAADYQKLLASRLKEQRDRRSESLAKKRSRLSSAAAKPVAA